MRRYTFRGALTTAGIGCATRSAGPRSERVLSQRNGTEQRRGARPHAMRCARAGPGGAQSRSQSAAAFSFDAVLTN